MRKCVSKLSFSLSMLIDSDEWMAYTLNQQLTFTHAHFLIWGGVGWCWADEVRDGTTSSNPNHRNDSRLLSTKVRLYCSGGFVNKLTSVCFCIGANRISARVLELLLKIDIYSYTINYYSYLDLPLAPPCVTRPKRGHYERRYENVMKTIVCLLVKLDVNN